MGFLDEAKDKAQEFMENVKDRVEGDDKPTDSDEPGGYSTEAAPDVAQDTQAAAPGATDSAAASVAETTGVTQGSAGSIADAPGPTEPA
ncbi:MAG TPA: hypothetical protein VJ625_04795, partial [Propionibacteriaceae bacterium]|nr:hypothetical protein [Propionibacteriaceae bacterium]